MFKDIDLSNLDHQSHLYQEHIESSGKSFLQILEEIRKIVDEILLDEQAEIWYKNPYVTHEQVIANDTSVLFHYPDKNCYMITTIFKEILLEKILEGECLYIKDFMVAGGLFHRSWGTYTNSEGKIFLQNFFQLGDNILDVSHEEMEKNDNLPVAIEDIRTGKYRNIKTLDEFIMGHTLYYNYALYSSVSLLGKYAYFYPIISENSQSKYLMQMAPLSEYRTNIPHYLKEQNTEIPQYIKDDLLWIISSMMAYDADEYDEVDIAILSEMHTILIDGYHGDIGDDIAMIQDKLSNRAGEENTTIEEQYIGYADDIANIISVIIDKQYDLNFYRRNCKTYS